MKDIISAFDNNIKQADVVRETGFTSSTISTIHSAYEAYKAGKDFKRGERYIPYIIKVLENRGTSAVETEILVSDENIFENLRVADSAYKEAISSFIEKMVKLNQSEIIKENETLKVTVARLQKENDGYNKAFIELKNANWVDSLKKHFSPAL